MSNIEGFIFAYRAASIEVRSALPDAPVVPHRVHRAGFRRRAGAVARWLAARHLRLAEAE